MVFIPWQKVKKTDAELRAVMGIKKTNDTE
jgi:hypothetical protein